MAHGMKRVMIIGQPGSGKSTLARRLGAITHLPVYHMDKIHWQPGWIERPREEKTRLCREVHAKPLWIFEGGHSITWPERLARADTLIWLDVGLARRAFRVVRRTLAGYGHTRADLPENCPEKFSLEFYQFIWRTRNTSRDRMAETVASVRSEKTVVVLSSLREVRAYLQDVATAMKAGALGLSHR